MFRDGDRLEYVGDRLSITLLTDWSPGDKAIFCGEDNKHDDWMHVRRPWSNTEIYIPKKLFKLIGSGMDIDHGIDVVMRESYPLVNR